MFSPPKERDKRKPQAWVTVWLEDYKGDVTHVRIPTNLDDVLTQARDAMSKTKKDKLKIFEVSGNEIKDGSELNKGKEYIVTSKSSPPDAPQNGIHPVKSPKEEKVVSSLHDPKRQKTSTFLSPTKKVMQENKIQSIKEIVAQDMLDDVDDTTDEKSFDKNQELEQFHNETFNKQLSFNGKAEKFQEEEKENIKLLQSIQTKNTTSPPQSPKEVVDLEHPYPQNKLIYADVWENQYKKLKDERQGKPSNMNQQLETQVSAISTSSSTKPLEYSQHSESFRNTSSTMDTIKSKHMDVHAKHELPFWEQVKRFGPTLFQALRKIPETQVEDEVLRNLIQEFRFRETSAKVNWHQAIIQEMRDQFICPNVGDSGILFKQDIRKKLNNILFNFERNGLLQDMCPNCIISGPAESGKTSTLFLMIKLLAEKLDSTGKWTEVFIFPVNWKKMLFTDSLDGFYLKFTQHVISCICNQRDSLRPFSGLLQKFFSKLLRQKWLPNIGSKKFEALFENAAHSIRNIGRRIINVWNKNSLDEFMSITMSLPNFLAEAFGLNRNLMVYDNLDETKVTMKPANISKKTTKPFYHYVKRSLKHSFGIISGDFRKMEDTLGFSKVSPIDIRDKFALIHTVGMISQHSIESLLPNQLVIENIVEADGVVEQHFIKTSELRGCPGYLAQFYQAYIQHISSPFFEQNENSQEPLIVRARNLVFDPEEMGQYAGFVEENTARLSLKVAMLNKEQ